MRKRVFGRKLKRTSNQRQGLFRSLMHAMILHGRIKTTEAKAKAIKGQLEKLVTKAKNKGKEAENDLMRDLVQHEMVEKLISNIAPRFTTRPGGYTRILRLGSRKKDNTAMVMLEWVEQEIITGEVVVASKKEKKVKVIKEKIVKEEKKTDKAKKTTKK
jgi:large subunit ribosomal protein L17